MMTLRNFSKVSQRILDTYILLHVTFPISTTWHAQFEPSGGQTPPF